MGDDQGVAPRAWYRCVMRLGEKQRFFAKCLQELLRYIHEDLGYEVTFGEAWRTTYQQTKYMADGKSWTMNSRHLVRCAVDLNLFINGRYMTNHDDYIPLGEYWKTLDPNCIWGGDWSVRDSSHFEVQ